MLRATGADLLGCRGEDLQILVAVDEIIRECVARAPPPSDPAAASDPQDVIGALAGAEGTCLRSEAHTVRLPPGEWWSVTGCGQTEVFSCGRFCEGFDLTCLPTEDVGRIDCATFHRG